MTSPMVALERARVIDLAGQHRLPTMFTQRPFVEAGGLLAYGVDLLELFRTAAGYVDKILKGAKLLRADQVIE